MAKFERILNSNFNNVLRIIDNGIIDGSVSATCEDISDFSFDGVRCAVRVYERYSALGGNRVSLNVTLFGNDGNVSLSAITSGGSQAMFFKLNTFGEKSFLKLLEEIVDRI